MSHASLRSKLSAQVTITGSLHVDFQYSENGGGQSYGSRDLQRAYHCISSTSTFFNWPTCELISGSQAVVKWGNDASMGSELIALEHLDASDLPWPRGLYRPVCYARSSQGCVIVMHARGLDLFSAFALVAPLARWMHAPSALRVLATVAEALSDMHTCGLCHLDVKLENVVLSTVDIRDGTLKLPASCVACLIDVGAAQVMCSTDIMSIEGSVSYCPPERFNKDLSSLSGPTVDAWGLGVIAYVLLTGEPFSVPTLAGRMQIEQLANQTKRSEMGSVLRQLVPSTVDYACACVSRDALPEAWIPLLRGLLDTDPRTRWSCSRASSWLRRMMMQVLRKGPA